MGLWLRATQSSELRQKVFSFILSSRTRYFERLLRISQPGTTEWMVGCGEERTNLACTYKDPAGCRIIILVHLYDIYDGGTSFKMARPVPNGSRQLQLSDVIAPLALQPGSSPKRPT